MHLIQEDEEDDTVIEDDGFTKLIAKWKKGFNHIKDVDISE